MLQRVSAPPAAGRLAIFEQPDHHADETARTIGCRETRCDWGADLLP
jgi:hypothetical protein